MATTENLGHDRHEEDIDMAASDASDVALTQHEADDEVARGARLGSVCARSDPHRELMTIS